MKIPYELFILFFIYFAFNFEIQIVIAEVSHEIFSEIKGNSKLEQFDVTPNLKEVLQAEISAQVKPTSIWLLDGRNVNEQREQSFNVISKELFTINPLILGDFGKGIRKRHIHLASFIFLIVVPTNITETAALVHKLELNRNERKDRFIFVGTENSLEEIFKSPVVVGLKDRIGVATNKEVIFIDPPVYIPGVMSKIRKLSERKFRPLMGFSFPGRHFKISGCLLPPWLMRISDENSPEIKYDGSNYRMFLEASKKFNYTFEISAPPGQGYGNLLPNGTWTGQASDLYYRERKFDLAILLGHVLSWFHFIDFAGNLDFANLLFLTSHPKLEINMEAFFYPYNTSVWVTVASFYLAISVVMFVLQMGSKRGITSEINWTTWEKFSTAMMIPFKVALEQNVKVPTSIRNLAALWMIAVIITGTGYRCNLASYLSFPTITPVPTTYGHLAYRKDYKVILNMLGVAEKAFFETNESPIIKTIKKRMSTTPSPIECVTKALIQPKTACIGWSPLIFAYAAEVLTINTRLDPLTPSKEPALPVSMSVGFVKDSIFVDAFTPVTTSIFETGIYNKWIREVFYNIKVQGKEKMSKQTDTLAYQKLKEYEQSMSSLGAFKPFSLKNLQFSFYILAAGAFMSLIAFTYETFISYANRAEKVRIKRREALIVQENRMKIFVISQLGII